MKLKKFFEDLLAKLEYRPIQVFMRHFQSAEMDLSAIAVAYYLLVTAFPLLVIAANIFPYFHINVSDCHLCKKIFRKIFMNLPHA